MDYLMIIVLVVVAIEIGLSGTWNHFYFSKGLAIYNHDIQVFNAPQGTLSPELLTERFSKGWSPSFLFRALSPTEIAFREKMIEFRLFSYTPVMHGLLHLTPERRAARVVGFINYWWVFLFGIMAAYMSYDMKEFGYFLFGFFGVFGLIYAIQRSRYKKIANAISEALKVGV